MLTASETIKNVIDVKRHLKFELLMWHDQRSAFHSRRCSENLNIFSVEHIFL